MLCSNWIDEGLTASEGMKFYSKQSRLNPAPLTRHPNRRLKTYLAAYFLIRRLFVDVSVES